MTIKIEFPALDRLMNYLETSQQAQVDAFVARFEKARSGTQTAMDDAIAATKQP